MADSLAALGRTRRGSILRDNGDALSLPGAGTGAKEVVGAAQEAAAMVRGRAGGGRTERGAGFLCRTGVWR
jgi:hypothetical protein